MIQLGKTQCLNIIKKTDFGVYLGTEDDKVLLPKKQVPEDIEIGDALTVFVYRDSSDRLIATTNTPKIELGGLARLKVSEVSSIGAFLDWGLEKNLLLPYREQTTHVNTGDEYLEIGFYNRYLLEALRVIDDETVKVRFNTDRTPMVLMPESGDEYLYIIYPLRLHAD